MYSPNEEHSAITSVISMVKSGESNVGFMTEILLHSWSFNKKRAEQIVLEGIIKASAN